MADFWATARSIRDKAVTRTLFSRERAHSTGQVRAPLAKRTAGWASVLRYVALSTLNLSYPKRITSNLLQETQWWPEDRLKDLQLEGLKQLVNWARNKCPYYRGFPPIDCLEDLKEYPILTKKIIHDNFNDLVARDMRLIVHKTRTGGTYSPVIIMRDIWFETARTAGEQRFRSWLPIGTTGNVRICHLWERAEIGPRPMSTPHDLYLPVEGLVSRNDAIEYLKAIKDFKPDHLQGFTLPLVTLAHYELEEHINPQIGAISCNCETLLARHRRQLEKAFRCQVFNFYGSQDLGSMAQDCQEHEGLHLNAERYVLEVTEDGRFLFTDLLSYAMPIIRYENQDMGGLLNKRCSCGRGLPLIKEVVGRVLSFVLTKKQTWVNIASVRTHMHRVKGFDELVEKYQLVQEDAGKISLLIKPWDTEKVPDLKALANTWPKDELDIEVKVVDSIVPSKSGKHLALVSKFTPPWLGRL